MTSNQPTASAPVRVDRTERVATLTLNRPEQRNAIDLATYEALIHELDTLARDPELTAICIEGAGPDFSVGEDLPYLVGLQKEGRLRQWEAGYRGFVQSVWHNPKVVIAKVRGAAWGIGCELALLADLTFADETATFGHPEVKYGVVKPTIWPWLVGLKLSKEYLATGKLLGPQEATKRGLVNRCVAAGELDAAVDAVIADLVKMPQGTPEANKRRIGWAFRDVSRVLEDDRFYDVDFDWMVNSRTIDYGFYNTVAEKGVHNAVKHRDESFDR